MDAIYIDPPYNTGAKDWKYNNDYVEADDAYRHSKWLAMMERRLKLAKRLLNPENSVLIVTIDEKEYLRLGLLLQQIFPDSDTQMVSTVIAPQGSQRPKRFSRVEEYIFCTFVGDSSVNHGNDSMLETATSTTSKSTGWDSLLRRGTSAYRQDREGMFYPVLIDNAGRIVDIGKSLGANVDRDSYIPPRGLTPCWPIRRDGSEGRWQVGSDTLRDLVKRGYAKAGRLRDDGSAPISYMKAGSISRAEGNSKEDGVAARTLWNRPSHNASVYGSTLLRTMLPGRKFPFPKALYAVEDTLRFFISSKPNATILDFFSGSGTTAHAVMRLNKQDGGQRQCISITNNEVSADEQKALRKKGLRPGDPEWEALGICDYITKPRIRAAITGQTPEGEPIKGDYKFTDEFPMADGFEENAEFFTLTYEAPRPIAHNKSFSIIAPLLWLKAGARGKRIDKRCEDFAVADTYGVLFDLDFTAPFIAAMAQVEQCRMAFIVTDDDRGFQTVCGELPPDIEAVRLYESYLTNFTINTGRD